VHTHIQLRIRVRDSFGKLGKRDGVQTEWTVCLRTSNKCITYLQGQRHIVIVMAVKCYVAINKEKHF